jgi:3-phenylpropionate/trans-cinnamate dioxygenase ferredoxin reductase component
MFRMTALEHVVIVGVSAAGITAAETLRAEGYRGRLTLVGEERQLPYDRPPLSKRVLTDAAGPGHAEIALRPGGDYADLDAEFLLGTSATALDASAHKLLLDRGASLAYDALVIATGLRPRRLPAAEADHDELKGVYVLRSFDDALALRAALRSAERVAVIGAGFLGTEVAAAARSVGLEVALIDPLPEPLTRPLGAAVGRAVGDLHREQGVELLTNTAVRGFVAQDGTVQGVAVRDVATQNGRVVPADVVVVAIGCVPATDWLADSGLTLVDGVVCDAFCEAALGVYAAGDIASWHDQRFGVRLRLEHRMNASEQAVAAARNLLGAQQPYTPVPYFWSDQYAGRLQAFGILPVDAEIALYSGDPREGAFVALYGQRGRVVGAVGWNDVRGVRAARKHVVENTPLRDLGGVRAFPEGKKTEA